MSRDLLLLGMVAAVLPGDCRTVAPVKVVQPEKVVAVTPVAHYAAPAYGPGFDANEAILLEILKELKANRLATQEMHADMLRLSGQQVPAALQGQALTAANVKTAKCAGCHGADVADEKGASFILVEADGTETPLSPVELRRVAREIGNGRMPPPGKVQQLTDAEKQTLLGGNP